MSNALAKELRIMWSELAADTNIKCTISNLITQQNTFDMGDQEGERSDDTAYIPKLYRFNVQEGYESTDGDFQDLVDRMIVVTRNYEKAFSWLVKFFHKNLDKLKFLSPQL